MAKAVKSRSSILAKELCSIRARDIMTRDVVTTKEDTTLTDVASAMIRKRISGMPVVGKGGKVTGMITATDLFLVMDMIKSGDIMDNEVMEVANPTVKFAMSTEVVKIKKKTTLAEIITIMEYRNIHTFPVFEGRRMVGVVGRRDVFKRFYALIKDLY